MVLLISSELSQKIYDLTYNKKNSLHDVLSTLEEGHLEKEMKILRGDAQDPMFRGSVPYAELLNSPEHEGLYFVEMFKDMRVDQMVETDIDSHALIEKLHEDIMGFVVDIGQAMYQNYNNQTISINPFAAFYLLSYPSYEFHARAYFEIRKFVGTILSYSMTPLIEGIDYVTPSSVEPCISDLLFYDARTCQSFTKPMKSVIDESYPLGGQFFHDATTRMFPNSRKYSKNLFESGDKKPIFLVEIIAEYLTSIVTAVLNSEPGIQKADFELLLLLEDILVKLELMDDVKECAYRVINTMKLPRTIISYIRYLYLNNEPQMKKMASMIEDFIEGVGCDSDTAMQYIQVIDFFHRKKLGIEAPKSEPEMVQLIPRNLHQKNIHYDHVPC